MNRFHEGQEKQLIEELEKECRKLPKGKITGGSNGSDPNFPSVVLFKRIHDILDGLTRLRTMKLVPVKKVDNTD